MIAKKIKQEMKKRGMKHSFLARAIGMSDSVFSGRLAGRTPFRAEEVAKIAEILNIPINELHEKMSDQT